jgi:hypothetical protein
MAVRPVRFISDLLTRKQILKTDIHNNVLFKVSSSNGNGEGCVSSSLPVTSSGLFIDGDALIAGTLTAKRMHITEVTTSVYYEDALSASINALQDVSASNANIGDVLKWDGTNWISSNQISGNFSGNLLGTASYAITSSYAVNANNAVNSLNANTASYALNAATAVTALYAVNAGNLIGSGTTNTIPVFTNDTSVGNSNLSLSGSTLIAGDDFVISGGLYFSNPSIMSSISPALSSATGFYGINDTFNAINDKFALLRNLYTYQFMHPGKKLNFMGNEFASFDEWDEKKSLPWFFLQYPKHANISDLLKDLNQLYRQEKSLHVEEHNPAHFQWLMADNYYDNVYIFKRTFETNSIICVFNMKGNYYNRYDIVVPEKGTYQEMLNSDHLKYGGWNNVNSTLCEARFEQGQYKITMTIGSFAAIVLKKVS